MVSCSTNEHWENIFTRSLLVCTGCIRANSNSKSMDTETGDNKHQIDALLNNVENMEAYNCSNLHATSIIAALGGINKVIRLCLTHPDSNSDPKYCNNVISTLNNIMSSQNSNKVGSIETTNTQIEPNRYCDDLDRLQTLSSAFSLEKDRSINVPD